MFEERTSKDVADLLRGDSRVTRKVQDSNSLASKSRPKITSETRNFSEMSPGVPFRSCNHPFFWYAAHIVPLHQCRFFLVALAGSVLAGCVFAQDVKQVADRVAAQNALFEEQYESDLRNFPERATAFGDYRYNDKLADYSLGAIVQREKTNQDFLARLEAIPTTGFSDQDLLSHDLLIRVLQQRIADFELKEYEMPINQQNGIHTSLADLPLSVPFDSVKHYDDYVARLLQVPRALNQTTEVLRAGMRDKLMPVRF